MSLYLQLSLLGMMLITKMFEFSKDDHPILKRIIESLGSYSGDEPMDEKKVRSLLNNVLACIEKNFSYYDAAEMKVNSALNLYLLDVFNDMHNAYYERPTTLAMTISGMGNKGGPMDQTSSLALFMDDVRFNLGKLAQLNAGEEEFPVAILRGYVRQLEYIQKVFELTDCFVACRIGAEAGLPEYPEVDPDDLEEIPDPDFDVDGLECRKDTDCLCGCALEHPLMIIEGMEHFLNGTESPAKEYFIGVANANNIRLEGYAGQEGPIFDAIKDMGEKAWSALTASLGAIKDLFTTSKPEEKVKSAELMADNNKKALQSMKDTAAVINDKAREGITNLMAEVDPSGKLKGLVSQLRTPSDAPKVIDALMGFMSKEATSGGKLNAEITDAQKAVAEIKTASSDTTGDESNKDVAKAKKAKVQDKVKTGKEKLKDVKFELAAHTKLMAGIQKAISGISPKIFIADTDKKGKKDE